MPKDRINISTGYSCDGCGRDSWQVYQGYNRCECGAYLWIEKREVDDIRPSLPLPPGAGIAPGIPRLDAGDAVKELDCIRNHAAVTTRGDLQSIGKLTFVETPLTTDLESGQFFALDQSLRFA